jgi:hypothetical protein
VANIFAPNHQKNKPDIFEFHACVTRQEKSPFHPSLAKGEGDYWRRLEIFPWPRYFSFEIKVWIRQILLLGQVVFLARNRSMPKPGLPPTPAKLVEISFKGQECKLRRCGLRKGQEVDR